ncbi:RNA-binding protein, partial [Vibrio vulnificus]|uniref:RNA-binding protein n=1 Tax=Vibrio vulnificus TaxID=672 RepID=UPI0019D42568
VLIAFLNIRIRTITDRIEGTAISPSDYAVYVQGLPENATEDDVEQHFNKLYNLREPDWTYDGTCLTCYCNRKPANMRRKQ